MMRQKTDAMCETPCKQTQRILANNSQHCWVLHVASVFTRKTLDSIDQNQVADQRLSLKQRFAGGAQSRGLRKPGCGHCYLKFFCRFFFFHTLLRVVWELLHPNLVPRALLLTEEEKSSGEP